MKRILILIAAVALLIISYASPAKAACIDTTIGATISVVGIYINNNKDYDSDVSDSYSALQEYVDVLLINTFNDRITTTLNMTLAGVLDDTTNGNVEVDEAYVTFEEFFSPDVSLSIGKKQILWELRFFWGAGTFEDIYPDGINAALVIDTNPLVVEVAYSFNETNTFTFIYAKIAENSGVGTFTNADDLDMYIIRYDLDLLDENRFFIGLIYLNDGDNNLGFKGSAYLINSGIDYFFADEALELYFEFAYQDGDPDASTGVDLGAFAINGGVEYCFKDSDANPFIGLDVTFFQGDSEGKSAFLNIRSGNWTHTLIAENNMGVNLNNWTPGYIGVKVLGGCKSLMNEKIAIDVIFGYFVASGDLTPAARENGLGWEFDVVATYIYTEDLTLTLGMGYFIPNEDLAGAHPDNVLLALFAVTILF